MIFKQPMLSLYPEVLPDAGEKDKSILRLHLFDHAHVDHEFAASMLGAIRDENMNLLTNVSAEIISETDTLTNKLSKKASSKEKKNFAKDQAKTRSNLVQHHQTFDQELKNATDVGIIKPSENDKDTYEVVGGATKVKNYVAETMSTITWGTETSMITNASLVNEQDAGLATVMMQRQGPQGSHSPQGVQSSGTPLLILPTQLNISTTGYPLFNFGQQFFFDFGTNTTADNLYGIVEIDEKMDAENYTCDVRLKQVDAFGSFRSVTDVVKKALTAIENNMKSAGVQSSKTTPHDDGGKS